MKILVLNAGSASLKFAVIDADASQTRYTDGRKLLTGTVDSIGADSVFNCQDGDGVELVRQDHAPAQNHELAARLLLDWIDSGNGSGTGITRTAELDLVAHRIVHGGVRFTRPFLIDESLTQAIDELHELAPLHGSGSLGAIRAAASVFGQQKPMIAVFDTAFHRTIPEYAALCLSHSARALAQAPDSALRLSWDFSSGHDAAVCGSNGRPRGCKYHHVTSRRRLLNHSGSRRQVDRHLNGTYASGRINDVHALRRYRPSPGRFSCSQRKHFVGGRGTAAEQKFRSAGRIGVVARYAGPSGSRIARSWLASQPMRPHLARTNLRRK
jgi:hypothetical protein